VIPGRQPDPGNGTSASGEPWGTWGGYFEWDPQTIVDSIDKWTVTLWVVSQSSCPNDIPGADTISTDITPRRLQRFQPLPGQTCTWALVRQTGGDTLQQGTVQADLAGTITVPGLLLIKEKTELMVSKPATGILDKPQANIYRKGMVIDISPNPFSSVTVIRYSICNSSHVRITIRSASGRLVKTLLNSEKPAGEYAALWDGKNQQGNKMSAGVYFCCVHSGGGISQNRMLILSDRN
jgi:hypothetical protein